jgi:hypothetical protein
VSTILVAALRPRLKPYERSVDLAIALMYSCAELVLCYIVLPFTSHSYPTVEQVQKVMTPMPIRARRTIQMAKPAEAVDFDDSWIAPSPLASTRRRRANVALPELVMESSKSAVQIPSAFRAPGGTMRIATTRASAAVAVETRHTPVEAIRPIQADGSKRVTSAAVRPARPKRPAETDAGTTRGSKKSKKA